LESGTNRDDPPDRGKMLGLQVGVAEGVVTT